MVSNPSLDRAETISGASRSAAMGSGRRLRRTPATRDTCEGAVNLHAITAGAAPPHDLNALIEIPLGGEAIFVARFLRTSMRYLANYSFIPQTLSEDGDPCDALVLAPMGVVPGAVVRCRPIGALLMEDQAEPDEKILAVPVERLHPFYTSVRSYCDLPEIVLGQIAHFFAHDKDLEPNKWTRIGGWRYAPDAERLVMEAIARAHRHNERTCP